MSERANAQQSGTPGPTSDDLLLRAARNVKRGERAQSSVAAFVLLGAAASIVPVAWQLVSNNSTLAATIVLSTLSLLALLLAAAVIFVIVETFRSRSAKQLQLQDITDPELQALMRELSRGQSELNSAALPTQIKEE